MPSMSNQFYNYIANVIYNFLQNHNLKAGDRFYLQLERQEEVYSLVHAIEKLGNSQTFTYQHPEGEPYETISLPINNVLLVIAYTGEHVNPDFLVTLRNQVVEQNNAWKGTALLSIVSSQLDSIEGGSSNLQKEGMPLASEFNHSRIK